MNDDGMMIVVVLCLILSMFVGIGAGNSSVCDEASKKGIHLHSCIFNQEIEK